MSLDTMTLEQALTSLTLPRVVGVDPESGEEITAQNGRYGPYLKKGTDSRSLDSEEQLLTINSRPGTSDLCAAEAARRRAASAPSKELGKDPATDKPVVVKDGRFGPYVTDGEVNATLRKADDVGQITIERAAELLAEKRAEGPAPKKRAAQEDHEEVHRQEEERNPADRPSLVCPLAKFGVPSGQVRRRH